MEAKEQIARVMSNGNGRCVSFFDTFVHKEISRKCKAVERGYRGGEHTRGTKFVVK